MCVRACPCASCVRLVSCVSCAVCCLCVSRDQAVCKFRLHTSRACVPCMCRFRFLRKRHIVFPVLIGERTPTVSVSMHINQSHSVVVVALQNGWPMEQQPCFGNTGRTSTEAEHTPFVCRKRCRHHMHGGMTRWSQQTKKG